MATAAQQVLPPPPPPHPSDRYKGRSDDKHRHHQASKQHKPNGSAHKASHAPPQRASVSHNTTAQTEADERLRRETPFIYHIRFKNDVPEIVVDPKMLVTSVQPNELAQFALTSLEMEPPRDMSIHVDLHSTISLMDVERFQGEVFEERPPLDPADEVLLGDDNDKVSSLAPSQGRVRQRTGNAELSWLLRTTYISAVDKERVEKPGEREKEALVKKSMLLLRNEATEEVDERDQQIDLIEATFEAAKAPVVHPRDPTLTPVSVMPVLPDFDDWGTNYLLAAFDTDPIEEVKQLASLPENLRRTMAARCMLKGFKVDAQEGESEPEKFMALIVPKRLPQIGEEENGVDAELLEGEYDWSKEYTWTMEKREEGEEEKQKGFLLRVGEDSATYCQTRGKLDLKRKASKVALSRPCKVVISRREFNDREEQERAEKLSMLRGDLDLFQEPEELEAEVEDE